jgi:hypothetical protein
MEDNSAKDKTGPPKATGCIGKAVGHSLAISSDKQNDHKQDLVDFSHK